MLVLLLLLLLLHQKPRFSRHRRLVFFAHGFVIGARTRPIVVVVRVMSHARSGRCRCRSSHQGARSLGGVMAMRFNIVIISVVTVVIACIAGSGGASGGGSGCAAKVFTFHQIVTLTIQQRHQISPRFGSGSRGGQRNGRSGWWQWTSEFNYCRQSHGSQLFGQIGTESGD